MNHMNANTTIRFQPYRIDTPDSGVSFNSLVFSVLQKAANQLAKHGFS